MNSTPFGSKMPDFSDFSTPEGHKTKTKHHTTTPNDIFNESSYDAEMRDTNNTKPPQGKPASHEQPNCGGTD